MPSHLVQRLDLGKLYLPFLSLLLDTLAACEKRGTVYVATLGFRTAAQQAKLYFQGRTAPGKIVTDARPGWSLHNYGLAVDCVRDSSPAPGLQPSWKPEDYAVLAEEADKHQLQANIPKGNDYGHVQLPVHRKINRSEHEVLKFLREAPTIEAAWSLLDVLGPW